MSTTHGKVLSWRGEGVDEKPQDSMGWGRAVAIALCLLLDTILVSESQTGKRLGKEPQKQPRSAETCWTKEALICWCI